MTELNQFCVNTRHPIRPKVWRGARIRQQPPTTMLQYPGEIVQNSVSLLDSTTAILTTTMFEKQKMYRRHCSLLNEERDVKVAVQITAETHSRKMRPNRVSKLRSREMKETGIQKVLEIVVSIYYYYYGFIGCEQRKCRHHGRLSCTSNSQTRCKSLLNLYARKRFKGVNRDRNNR